jgi:hypothetical protein
MVWYLSFIKEHGAMREGHDETLCPLKLLTYFIGFLQTISFHILLLLLLLLFFFFL